MRTGQPEKKPRRRRKRAWARLSEIHPELPDAPATARLIDARIAWRNVAGPLLADRLAVIDREGDALVLSVPHTGWLTSLPQLEDRVRPLMARHPALRDIRRLVGRVKETPPFRPPRCAPSAALEPAAGEARARLASLAERLLARRS